MLCFSNYVSAAILIAIAIRRLYRTILEETIPGIPNNREAINLLGDFPKFQKWHKSRKEMYAWIVSQSEKYKSSTIQLFMHPFGKPWVVILDSEKHKTSCLDQLETMDELKSLATFLFPYHRTGTRIWRLEMNGELMEGLSLTL